ncbi:BlaI/MecI/CopY family transcriptional regulator, partial [Aeriscardovia aeriphila]
MSDTNAEVSLISPSEWELMRVVWTEGPSKAKTLVENMSKKSQWSESTTKTLLRRLVSKGILTTKSVEGQRGFLYTPTVAEKEAMRDQA